jgi:hypothetical protein
MAAFYAGRQACVEPLTIHKSSRRVPLKDCQQHGVAV